MCAIAAPMARVLPWYWTRGWVRRYRLQDSREILKNIVSLHTKVLLDGTVLTVCIKFHKNHTHFLWNKHVESESKPGRGDPRHPSLQHRVRQRFWALLWLSSTHSTHSLPWGGRLWEASVTAVALGKVSHWQGKNSEVRKWTGILMFL